MSDSGHLLLRSSHTSCLAATELQSLRNCPLWPGVCETLQLGNMSEVEETLAGQRPSLGSGDEGDRGTRHPGVKPEPCHSQRDHLAPRLS